MRERRHFDTIAPHYYRVVDAVRHDNGYYHSRELELVRRVFHLWSGRSLRVLDAGCGPGRHAATLARLGHEVAAVDFSEVMLRLAREVGRCGEVPRRIRVVQSDVRALPFASASFDAVVCMEVLEHLPGGHEDARAVLQEFRRVLRDGGVVILEAPLGPHQRLRSRHWSLQGSWRNIGKEARDAYAGAPLETCLAFEEGAIGELLAHSGFGIVGTQYVRVIPAGLIERFPMLEPIDRVLERKGAARHLAREAIWIAEKIAPPGPEPGGGESARPPAGGGGMVARLLATAPDGEDLAQRRRRRARWRKMVDRFRRAGRPLVRRALVGLARPVRAAGGRVLRRMVPLSVRALYSEMRRPGLPSVLARERGGIRGAVIILSAVPIADSGGGQRPAQLAIEFLAQGYLVVYVHMFPTRVPAGCTVRLRHPHRLLRYRLEGFDWESVRRRYRDVLAGQKVLVLVEWPGEEFARVACEIKAAGGQVVYDCIDDWTTSLGGTWYSEETERRIIAASDVLVGTAALLQERLMKISGRRAILIPNAVNTDLFRRGAAHPRPADLPPSPCVICYVGALWGDWVHWDLLRKVALAYPAADVVVIGDYHGQCPNAPSNLHFLGSRPHRDVPAYLACADVAIIPWHVSRLTHAVSPVKVYEYLAMGKPVVAPRIRELEGMPYLLLADSDEEFIAHIGKARALSIDGDALDAFVRENSWTQRVAAFLRAASEVQGERPGAESPGAAGPGRRSGSRRGSLTAGV
jgi:ubiquinone/menaquinone biosynthesis C-methylase UbiE/glycosyltransferase involved in cell wall biosynthesis